MRILFVSAMTHYPWAGSEELWGAAAMQLRERGHDVCALVGNWPRLAPELQQMVDAGAEVRMRSTGPARTLLARVRRQLFRKSATSLANDFAWIKRQAPDLACVSNGNYFDGIDVMEFCANEGIPFTSICQANAEWLWPADDLADRIVDAYSQTRAAFFVSRRNLDLAEHQLGCRLRRAEIVRNPYKVPWDSAPAWPDESDGMRLACVARYEPSAKGQDLLLEVLAMPKWRERNISVQLFGTGPMQRSLARLVSMYGLVESVCLCGFVGDVQRIWETCHALVLPSRYEGLPLAIVEAMLCGRPCIVTDVGGNTELLEVGRTGFVAAAPTVAALDEALEAAWQSRSNWRAMGLLAQERARSLVPRDPGAVFAERLIDLATSGGVA